MKVFNGKEFLATKGVKVSLSNGKEFEILEVAPEQLDKITSMPDEPDSKAMIAGVASILGCTSEDLEGIGIVELKGVMDFLSANLLS